MLTRDVRPELQPDALVEHRLCRAFWKNYENLWKLSIPRRGDIYARRVNRTGNSGEDLLPTKGEEHAQQLTSESSTG